MMEKLEQELHKRKAKRVLDLATRRGDFAANLAKGLEAFDELIAIDIDEKALALGREALAEDGRIRFECGDAYDTGYADGSFDLVAMGNSLHHFEHLPALFREIHRLLTRGGTLLISEMTADSQEGGSRTHALLHRWESDVDTAKGIYHRHTYTQQEILDMVTAAGFRVEQSFLDWDREPKLKKGVEKRLLELDGALEQCRDLPNYQALAEDTVQIKASYEENGVAFAAALVVIGEK